MAKTNIKLSESLEDYLEVILELEKTNKVARTKDISNKMGVQRGTVTGALKSLGEKGLINYEPYCLITLTRKGTKIAKEITKKHYVLKDFLSRILQINEQSSEQIACRMEHAMDQKSTKVLIRFIKFLDTCPRAGTQWIKNFVEYCKDEPLNSEKCNNCIEECLLDYNKKTIDKKT